MTRNTSTLLEELVAIDAALLDDATAEQEARGQELVQLADAAPKLFEALHYFFNITHDYENSLERSYVELALKMARDALAEAKGTDLETEEGVRP
jgi:hypothetical protein